MLRLPTKANRCLAQPQSSQETRSEHVDHPLWWEAQLAPVSCYQLHQQRGQMSRDGQHKSLKVNYFGQILLTLTELDDTGLENNEKGKQYSCR